MIKNSIFALRTGIFRLQIHSPPNLIFLSTFIKKCNKLQLIMAPTSLCNLSALALSSLDEGFAEYLHFTHGELQQ
jgi:hypothetical protein